MKLSPLLGLLFAGLAGLGSAASSLKPRDFNSNDYYVLHLDRSVEPVHIAARLGLRHEGSLGELSDHHLFSAVKRDDDIVRRALQYHRRKRSVGSGDIIDNVLFHQKQVLRNPMEKRLVPPRHAGIFPVERQTVPDPAAEKRQKEAMEKLQISDPIFKEQWHLFNTLQVGHDVNVLDVWLAGTTGKNTTVAIVDDGLDMYSGDLKPNYYAQGSYDFNDHREEPRPTLSDDKHGTRCAGEVSAARNEFCGVGVAYDSKIAGLRILSKMITDADEAIAMNYDYQHNDIYSCSWGPPDDGQAMDAPGILIRRAMLNGVQNGRGSLGSIYVFASGNGALSDDNCNFDGYTNSIYSITVGAVDHLGKHPYYSEKCSAQLTVTYSSGDGESIHTTDVGESLCTDKHGGTSAAAPLAAGIFALALDVRPDLSWRDMQYIVLETAVPLDADSPDSQTTTIGKKFSHTFGYGKIDTHALVEAAKTWKSVKPQSWYFSPWIHVNHEIPQGDQGLLSTFEVTEAMLKEANLEKLEHVTVTMNVKHTCRGDLSVDLISPDNLVSHIATVRRMDTSKLGYDDWTFMSVVHWGEKGVGTWKIIVRDTVQNEDKGTFVDWHLKLWGVAIDPTKTKVLPMPSEEDDANHADIATTTMLPATTSLGPHPDASNTAIMTELPSDHPQRPTKPTGTAESDTTATGTDVPAATASQEASTWVPSFLPTFGASPNTAAWIYGAIGLIVLFVCGLGIWWWIVRRRRLRNNSRDNYEFELLNEEEGEGLNGGPREKGQRRRGGELYDAFAGGSDEEEDGAPYEDREEPQHHTVCSDEEDEEDDDVVQQEQANRGGQSARLLGRDR